MRVVEPRPARLRALLSALFAICLGACSLLDSGSIPRTYDVNVASAKVREDSILLNIVRASNFEPLNFVSLSKYTGTQTVASSAGFTINNGVDFAAVDLARVFSGAAAGTSPRNVYGPNGITASTGGNFDTVPLETKEFYAGFLSPIDLKTLHILLSAGLTRELVLHAVVKAARVTKTDGSVIEYFNDPENDHYHGGGSDAEQRVRCEREAADPAFRLPYGQPIWNGTQERDCQYQKFLVFMGLAMVRGVTTEVLPPKAKKSGAKSASGSAATDKKADSVESQDIGLCYDAALARLYGPTVTRTSKSACGSGTETSGKLYQVFTGSLQAPTSTSSRSCGRPTACSSISGGCSGPGPSHA